MMCVAASPAAAACCGAQVVSEHTQAARRDRVALQHPDTALVGHGHQDLHPQGELPGNTKWLVGVKYLPTGWEVGFNHYTGRLGIKLPETAALLQRYSPDW